MPPELKREARPSEPSLPRKALGALRALAARSIGRIAALVSGTLSRFLLRRGYYLLRKHYYLPIPDETDLAYARETSMVGIDVDAPRALAFLDEVVRPYRGEFARFPAEGPAAAQPYYLLNGRLMAVDGDVYYYLVRHLKPARIVEIGSGFSTYVAAAAIAANLAEQGRATALTCVEPYPLPELAAMGGTLRLEREPVQRVSMDVFTSLGENDILFIDSTHALKSGGDVWFEYCEILPRLRPGVYVHVHDVSLPKPYPKVYFDQHLYWNEQYVLQAFLTFNSRVEVVWPGNYMMCAAPDRMAEAFAPGFQRMRERYPSSEPTSFWFRMK
jgi:predicted O-methyltransferase YrrM